ncbi:hypothetical protein THRCLA_00227, partial [Thraustotheca clavata]
MQVARHVPARLVRASGHCRQATVSAKRPPVEAPPPSMALVVVDGALLMFVCEVLNQIGAKEPILSNAIVPMAIGATIFPVFARVDTLIPSMMKPIASALGKRFMLINTLYLSMPLAVNSYVQSNNNAVIQRAQISYKQSIGSLVGIASLLGVWGSFFAVNSIPRSIAR